MNHVLQRFWTVYSPDLCTSLAKSLELVLESTKPSFIQALKLPFFSLGSTAPRFAHSHVNPSLDPDLIQLDLDLNFEPLSADDYTETTGARIQFIIKLLKVDLPVSVRDIHFRSKIRLQMRLIPAYPYVKMVTFCFLDPPDVNFILKPLIPLNVHILFSNSFL